jgi:hypothetical protein
MSEITQNADVSSSEETPLQKKVLKGHLPDPPREKKERTAAQVAAFERARASRESNLKKREADAKRLAEYDAMILKQKLVEKANKIKLKTMRKVEAIESVSSDDEVVIERPSVGTADVRSTVGTVPRESKRAVENNARSAPTEPKPIKPKIIPYKFV